MLGAGCLAREINRARPGAPNSSVSEPCWGRSPPLLFSTSYPRKVCRAEQLRKGEPLASASKGRWTFSAEPFLPRAPFCPLLIPMAFVEGSQLWSHCRLQKDGMLSPGIVLGVSQQAYLLHGDTTTSPVGHGVETQRGLVSKIHLSGLLQNAQNWGQKKTRRGSLCCRWERTTL